ncbi:MAG TPA: hypothetical protein VND98_10860 [Solirubrobacterales bacterium]|nr:hypothetical protein [Solirubrobacterales bacterium]
MTAASGGSALANIEACVEVPRPAPVGQFDCATTNGRGEYTIMALWAGSYRVEFHADHEGGNFGPQPFGGNPVEVTVPNTASGIDAEMQPGGQITGEVIAASGGAAIANVEVCVGGPPSMDVSGCSTSNGSGEYTISGLSSGSYDVGFYPYEGGDYVFQSDNGVSVIAGSTISGINAAMPSGEHITGIVTASAGGARLANVEVCAQNTSYTPYGGNSCATTNGGGSASATSNVVTVPVPNNFSMAKKTTFDARTGDLNFYLKLPDPGTVRWSLTFKNPDAAAFADSMGLSLDDYGSAAEKARKPINV